MSETILITGVSGFIAKYVALSALRSGLSVRGTVRDAAKGDAVTATLRQAGADVSRLECVPADLERDDGWAEAARGVDGVIHVASPFPLQQPKGRFDLVPAAKGGTLRVLNAVREHAPAAERIVITSSMVALMYRPDRPRRFVVHEQDWTDTSWPALSPYIVSKTLAERAAWDWAREHGYEQRLVAINPGFVLGPALDTKSATSLDVIQLLFSGKYPALPPVSLPVVDVRDLGDLHVAALSAAETGGRRLMASAGTVSMLEMATMLKQAFPDKGKRIPTRTLPAALVRVLALFDRSLKTILADMHVVPHCDNAYVEALTGIRLRPPQEAILAAGRSLIERGLV